ncbi:MAG TPA: chalcone isomerase family protein [Acidisoma sp.]|jgi:hypothetical protein|uniref:chalcone isomerase family protein n=1 Tax=Acidisoma sp. TaxID=1872115 RepID=UPI002C3042D6|nr:chalcone isomerase family protein [Acidisoma sp.]HTI00689.1 chalcone isomerase family protein [Acidisoma sp.]
MSKHLTTIQAFVLTLCLAWTTSAARAAELDGITMPDHMVVDGTPLILNGMALRTASLLRVRVYVVGLYLQQPGHDTERIVGSSQVKLLHFVFLHDVSAAKARASWRNSLARNCPAPCRLRPDEVAQFLASIPAMRAGYTADVLFVPRRVDFIVNGRSLGQVTDPIFARVILLCYIGPQAKPAAVRNGVLGLR